MKPSSPTRTEVRALVRLAIPLAIANAGQSLMGVVDAAVVGRAGAAQLAGVGLGSLLFFAVSVLGMGTMMGLDPLVSQALGAGDGKRARHFLWQGAWLSLVIGTLLCVPLGFVPLLLGPLGIAPDVASQASGHLLARLPSLPALLFFFAARSYLQGSNAPRAVVLSAVMANVVNLLLDLLLVFGGATLPAWAGPLRAIPALGAVGSGIATAVATWLQAGLRGLGRRADPGGRALGAPAGAPRDATGSGCRGAGRPPHGRRGRALRHGGDPGRAPRRGAHGGPPGGHRAGILLLQRGRGHRQRRVRPGGLGGRLAATRPPRAAPGWWPSGPGRP